MTRHPRSVLRAVIVAVFCYAVAVLPLGAQSAATAKPAPSLTGAWEPLPAARAKALNVTLPPVSAIVLKPQYAKDYEARRAAETDATRRGEPPATAAVLCTPYGMPRMMAVASYPVEILQTPGQVTIITEAFSEVRRVYMNQPQMPIEDVPPGYYGHSVGRWDGDTLVIDTVGIKESIAGYSNLPHSDQLRIVERMRLATPDVLLDEITLHDPVVLEKPVTYTLGYRKRADYKMVEFVCENNREYVDEQGRVRMRIGR